MWRCRRVSFRQAAFRCRSYSDGAGLGGARRCSPGDDYTTIPSGPATAGARGAPLKVYLLYISETPACAGERPEISAVERPRRQKDRRPGKLWHLPDYEVRVLIEK